MLSLLYLALTAFGIGLVATPVTRNFLRRSGLLDRPDAHRKLHASPVPRLGGIPIAAAFALSLTLFRFLPGVASPALDSALDRILPLIPGALIVFLVGVLDDLYDLRPWQKLSGQLAAAVWVFAAGLHIQGVAGHTLAPSPWITFPITILWLVACTNAFNLIDGVDGLAAGVGFFATVTIFLSATLKGDAELQILAAPLAGALLAFLRYNFNPATIFLGDSGAMLIGFLLGGFSIIWSHKSATILGMTAPVFALAFPIAETAVSVARRWLRGDPIFSADRGHIHHRLLEMGLGSRQVAILLYAVTGLGAAVSLIVAQPDVRERSAVVILFCAVAWVGFQRLGYAEFASARRILLGGGMRRRLAADIQARAFESRMNAAGSFEERWAVAVATLPELGFHRLEIEAPNVPHRWAEFNPNPLPKAETWSMTVPLGDNGKIELQRRLSDADPPPELQSILQTLQQSFTSVLSNSHPPNPTPPHPTE